MLTMPSLRPYQTLCDCQLPSSITGNFFLPAGKKYIVRGQVAVLVIYMISGKVFSPQHLVLLLPLGLFLSLRRGPRLTRLLLVVLGLTQLVFPALYDQLKGLSAWAFAVVLLRNCLLLGWALLLLRGPRLRGGGPLIDPVPAV